MGFSFGNAIAAVEDPHVQACLMRLGNTVAANDKTLSTLTRNNLLVTNYALRAITLNAGAGMTGGGDLSADRTFNVGAGLGITVAADTVAVDQTLVHTWTGIHTFTAQSVHNAGVSLGTTGILTSAVADGFLAIGMTYKPSLALTADLNRDLHSFQDSTGAVKFVIKADSTFEFGGRGTSGGYITVAATPPTTASFGILFQPFFVGAGAVIQGVSAAIAGAQFIGRTAAGATSTAAIGGNFVSQTNIGSTTYSDSWGGFFQGNGVGAASSPTTNIGGWKVFGVANRANQGANTNWFGGYVANSKSSAMASGQSLVNTYGLYLEEQTRATTINSGLFLANATSGYKAIAIRDQNAWISSNAANYLDLHAATDVRANRGASGAILAGSVTSSIFTQTADKTVGNTTTETTLFGTGSGTLTLPANFFVVGRTIRVRMCGVHSVTGSETMRYKAYLGSTAIGDTTAVTEINDTSEGWELSFIVTCRTTGATGTVATSGIVYMHEATTALDGLDFQTTAGTTYTIDTTASQVLDIKVTHGTANAGNTITCMNATVEVFGG